MFYHKEGCQFHNFYKNYSNDDAPNTCSIEIDEYGIHWDENTYTVDARSLRLEFNFCPICGVKRELPSHV